MQHEILETVFVLLASACLVVPLISRFRLGSVVGYILAGILVGPSVMGFISDTKSVMHFAEIGIVMMLFLIGLELKPALLWKQKSLILGLGTAQVFVTSLALATIGVAFGYSLNQSFVCALALSLSSTSVVLHLLKEKGLMSTSYGHSVFSVLLFQDIAFVPILLIFPLLTLSQGPSAVEDPSWVHGVHPIFQVGLVALSVPFIMVIVHYFSRSIFSYIARTNLREVFTASSLALIVGITLLMEKLGLSPALGAFLAGVILANSEYKHTIEVDIQPFKELLLGLFFISVGMAIDLKFVFANWAGLTSGMMILLTIKALVLWGLSHAFGLGKQNRLLFALTLAQGGEFAFALLQYAESLNILSLTETSFLTALVTLSIVSTPLLLFLGEKITLLKTAKNSPDQEHYDKIYLTSTPKVIIVGYGRFGQVIGRFLKTQGLSPIILENDPQQVALIRKFGGQCYFGDASRLDILKHAGAKQAKMLIIATGHVEKGLDIVRMARAHFPNLAIFSRARNRRHAFELHKLGVDYFRRETFDSALTMAQDVMKFFGADREEIAIKAWKFREHDEKTLHESFAFFEQERKLIAFSRQASGELEAILQQDHKEHEEKEK